MQKLSISIKNFNERVKIMNQTGGKQLSMSADEARNLHADIFNLLANLNELQTVAEINSPNPNTISLDGGGF